MYLKHIAIKRLVISAILSIVLLVAGYFVNNLPLFTGEDITHFYLTQVCCEWLGIKHDINNDDAFFVNVSYDKEIATALDANGDTIGNTAITDRKKLYDFLSILKNKPNYKYVIVDLCFDKNHVTAFDSNLYDLICSMDNIVIVEDDNIKLPKEEMYNKSAYANYYSTIAATNFKRFQYINSKDERSIPLKVYEDMNPDLAFRRHGISWLPFYTSGNQLWQSSGFILFERARNSDFDESNVEIVDFKDNDAKSIYISHQTYFNLGKDLLENKQLKSTEERVKNISDKAEDAYVIIGNFTEDRHDTYVGLKPGPYILYRALKTLENRSNVIDVFFVIYWFIIYMLIFYFIISQIHILRFIKRKKSTSSRVWNVLIEIIGYSLFLFICATIEYIFTETINSLVLPIIVFSFVKFIINNKNIESA